MKRSPIFIVYPTQISNSPPPQVLSDNMPYISSSLDLEGVDLAWSTELGEKGEDCRPGAPFIAFRTEPSVALSVTNTQVGFSNNYYLPSILYTSCPCPHILSVPFTVLLPRRSQGCLKPVVPSCR